MRKVEMLLDVRDAPGYLKGEVRFVSEETAQYFCGLGWAKDLEGGILTAAPDTTEKTLDVQNGQHGHNADSAGV